MLLTKPYIRNRATAYAAKWAFDRNPLFVAYDGIGGDCTNFISQCVYAGSCVMNFKPVFGWYYVNDTARTASWTGVEYFYNFIVGNRSVGPFGKTVAQSDLLPGDVVQLGRNKEGYYHTMLFLRYSDDGDIMVSSHSDDSFDRPLSSYDYDYNRCIHIDGVRQIVPGTENCFDDLYEGVSVFPLNP